MSSVNACGAIDFLPLFIPLDTIFTVNRAVDSCVLVAPQSVDPRAADLGTIEHKVDLYTRWSQ
ncbi:hypothetical protein RRF57_000275 [Xylaria bambusicola]|uniref:Uncharacterized protein n=1 Tax=Xylaria bambusicola TaxID=326684 RepID=A0AAN7UNB7_9PEZI